MRIVISCVVASLTCASLACAMAGGLLACSSVAGNDDGAATPMPEEAPCIDMKADDRYARLTLGEGADGIAFFTTKPGPALAPGAVPTPLTLGAVGTPCGNAKDVAACRDAVAKIAAPDGGIHGWISPGARVLGPPSYSEIDYAVATQGDRVWLIMKPADVRALVKPIDTVDEAATIAELEVDVLACRTRNMRTDDDGWTFQWIAERCDQGVNEHALKVKRTGEIVSAPARLACPVPNY